ncbi:MAG: hypothetical protein S4CHLAM45_15480 [Chlamydiales bacterium]|nr:hypothetical protein [Chlamydiales bacterium]
MLIENNSLKRGEKQKDLGCYGLEVPEANLDLLWKMKGQLTGYYSHKDELGLSIVLSYREGQLTGYCTH